METVTAAIERHGRSRMLAPRRLQPTAEQSGDLGRAKYISKCANTEHVLLSFVRFSYDDI